jgi:hypothetical protein
MAAWSDLSTSLYPNRTLNEHASMLLLSTGNALGRPGRDMRRVQDAYFRNEFEPVLAMAKPRSPINHLKQLNANRPAILITGGWLDGVFPPGQLPAFYAGLRGPKMLMLQPGDHGTAELPGALGTANDAWTATTQWFDHYLKGVDNGIDRQAPVRIKAANGGGWTGFSSWSAMGRKTLRYRLGPAERLTPSGQAAAPAGRDSPDGQDRAGRPQDRRRLEHHAAPPDHRDRRLGGAAYDRHAERQGHQPVRLPLRRGPERRGLADHAHAVHPARRQGGAAVPHRGADAADPLAIARGAPAEPGGGHHGRAVPQHQRAGLDGHLRRQRAIPVGAHRSGGRILIT